MESELEALARGLGQRLQAQGQILATAESCTGGWVAKVMTDISGSSAWFDCGFVTYSNQAKQRMLAVPAELLAADGAVSEGVVKAMVRGALQNSGATLALAISGVAGPDGGSAEKPVGTVWFGWGSSDGRLRAQRSHFDGDRAAVRRQAVAHALNGVAAFLD
jgi:nicotinamide-nucleotide amidase